MLIGLHGYAGSGKDTVADILVEHLGYTKFAYATPLKEGTLRLNPIIGVAEDGELMRMKTLVDTIGWDRAKWHPRYGDEVRGILQRVGTDLVRETFGPSAWVELGRSRVHDAGFSFGRHAIPGREHTESRIAFADARFPSEAESILEAGGQIWRIDRPGVGAPNGHSSENPLPPHLVTLTIVNDGPLDRLRTEAVETWQWQHEHPGQRRSA